MGAVSYTIKTFNPEEAASGALCIVLNYTQYNNTGNNANVVGATINPDATYIDTDNQNQEVPLIVGTGICKRRGDLFTITINSTNYTFNIDGTGYSGTARGKYLYRCEVNDSTVTQMNSATVAGKFTRGTDGSWSYTSEGSSTILLDSLTVRDEFAAQALRGILARIDNPSVLSEDEIKFYCDAAYKWAESMLKEAAKTRAGVVGGSSDTTRGYTDGSEAILAEIADAISNINISGGGGSVDTSGLVAVLDKMLYTIKSEGRWHYHTAIINDSGQFKFVYRPIYGRAQVKLEYYDSNGNLLPESTVTNWSGKRYTASDAEIDDGGNLIKTYSQLIDMIMTDSAVADSEGYYYKATPQYPSGSNVIVASVKVFVDVSGGGSGESAFTGPFLIGNTTDNNQKVPLDVHSEGVMTVKNETVTEGNTTFTNPLNIDGSTTTKIVDNNYNTLGTSNDPLTVKLNSSAQIRVDNVNSNGLKVSEQNEDRTVSFASGASVGVSGTLALENAEDSNNDPKPIIVEGTGTTVVRNDVVNNNPTPFLVSTSTDLQDELNEIKESIDSLIDWEKAYEVGTATISTTAGLFNLRPLPDNVLKMRIRIYDGNGDKVNITPDTLATYQWFNNENAVTDLSDSIYFKDIISALRNEPSETVTHLQIGSQGINSTYATPIKIVVDYVYGNTGSNSTNRTVSGSLSIENKNDINDLLIPIKVDSIPWAKLGEFSSDNQGNIEIPNLSLYEYVKIDFYYGSDIESSEGVDCLLTWESESGGPGYVSVVLSALGYIKIPSDATDISISRNNGTFHSINKIVVYVAGNVGTSGGGSGGSGSSFSGAITSIPALHIGSTSSSTARGESTDYPFYISMPGYLPLTGGTMTGNVMFNGGEIRFMNDYTTIRSELSSGSYLISLGAINGVQLRHNGVTRISTSTYGVNINGGLGVSAKSIFSGNVCFLGDANGIEFFSDINAYSNNNSNGVLKVTNFGTANSPNYDISFNGNRLATRSQLSGYLKLTGGTMENSIVTPGSDSYGIYPQTSGYGFVGSNTNWYYKMYGCQLNAETLTLYSNNNGSRSVMGGIDSNRLYLYPGTGFFKFQVNSDGDINAHRCNLSDSLQVIPFTYNNSIYYRVTATDSGGLTINERRLYIGNSYMQITNSGGGSVKQQADGATYKFEASPNSGGQSGVTSFLFNKDIITEGLYSIRYLSGASTFNAKQWFTNDSAGMIYHFGCYDQNGNGMSADILYDFEGTVRANNISVSSDIRLKSIVSHEVLGVNEIAEMPLVKFSWKEDKEKKVHFGTIAQDWEKVMPEVVIEGGDGMKAMDYGAAAMAAGVTACREIVALKEENKELKKTVEYLKKELEAIKEIVYGKKENDMED